MRKFFLMMVAVLAMAAVTPSWAQVPTAEQMELLRSMSPEDREALMQQLGVGGAVMGGSGETGSLTGDRRNTRDRNFPVLETEAERELRDKRLRPDDTLIIDLDFQQDVPPRIEDKGDGTPPTTVPGKPAPTISAAERELLQDVIDRVRSRNPYQLDATGALQLPGFTPVVLAGLDDEQASRRLAAMPMFFKLEVKVTRLPVRKTGIAGLKPFGYDLFKDRAAGFDPVTDVPVPADYIVGPGDRLNVQLFGTENRNLRLTVDREGRVSFPEIGPIQVGGRSFERVASDIEARVTRDMIGVRASVSMGETRTIQVFVMGEVNRPGSYTVSGLGTITSALYVAGGFKPIGSLRDVQLKRQGALVRRLDLYDLLLRGDTSNDANLLPGDVIFIPPVANTVAVDGEVQRPAIYEIKGETTVAEIVKLAGGLTNNANTGHAALVRVNDKRERVVVDVKLDEVQGEGQGKGSEILRNGDSLRVLRLPPTLDKGVTVEGHVFAPGYAAWHEGLRLTDVVRSVDDLRENADLSYVLIRRELPPDRRIVAVSADLSAALRDPASEHNVPLMPRDRIIVFSTLR